METKNIIIICVTLVAIVAIVSSAFIYINAVKDTNLSLKESTVTQGDSLTFSLVDSDGNPLVNKNLTVDITNSKNETNSYNLTTDSKGVAKLKIKSHKGRFTVNVVFDGELLLKSSEITQNITVKEKEKPAPKVSSVGSDSIASDAKAFSEYSEYIRSKGSSFYNSHSNWDDDGDGYISRMEENMHEG